MKINFLESKSIPLVAHLTTYPMASVTLFLLFAVQFASQATAQKNDSKIIPLGSSLSPKPNSSSSWVSPSGLFSFGFYPQGNGFAVGIWLKGEPENTIVWTANRDSPPASSDFVIKLTEDNLLLLGSGKEIVELTADLSEPAASASMLDSGNFVLYAKNHSVIWQSFDSPTDTILGGQNLTYYHGNLVSALSNSDHSSGNFALGIRSNGNLYAHTVNTSGDYYWSTDDLYSYWTGDVKLSLNVTGFLEIRNGENIATVHVLAKANSTYPVNSTTIVFRATLDVDGIFRLYAHLYEKNTSPTVKTMWESLSSQCEVDGFCGLNSYCNTTNGSKGVCRCYPGLVPFRGSSGDMFLDCEKINKDDCETSADPGMLYNVTSLQKLQWSPLRDPPPYLVMPMKMEACGKSCQEDCNCGAALYVNGSCNKYKLPLQNGRIVQNASGTAFFKLPSGDKTISNKTIPFARRPTVHDDKENLILTLVLTLGSISLVCLVFALSIFFIYRRQAYLYTKLSASRNLGFTEDCNLQTFSFDDLVNSTGNFKEEIGRGTFGVVYKGTICESNRRIAVKKLDVVVEEGEREFQAEITAIAQTHHRNLVRLIGYCIDKKLLVYEYMSNGSLANFLYKAEMHLSWKLRVKIALDVARGVLYLHEECEFCIVHCNIKPQNILMDESWTAKISDFGFARLLLPEQSRRPTGNEVSSSYMAPERQKDASVSVKVDIYSYGVVLLEIICCRRSIDVKASSSEEIMLSSWVYNCFVRGELNKLVVDNYEEVESKTMERMVKVGLWCVQEDSSLRPSMKNVILMLEGLKDIPIPPSPSPLVS